INGNRNEPIVPKTSESIVESAVLSIEKGAESIHFHARDDKGNETLKAYYVDKQIEKLRTKIKDIPIGISTGEWIEPNLNQRLEQIDSWQNLPDFVSINYDEKGFEKVTKLISEKGIKIEIGLNSLVSGRKFYKKQPAGRFFKDFN